MGRYFFHTEDGQCLEDEDGTPLPSDDAAPRWAGSAQEQKELDALRLVTVLRDGPQHARLIRISAAQRRVAELVAQGWAVPVSATVSLPALPDRKSPPSPP